MANSDVAVKVEGLTKSFRIPLEANNGLKQKLINTVKGIKGYREFSPLDDVSFEIKKGEFFGIVGRNGSGKSTLLKTIAGIYTPTKGVVHVAGTLVPFIELGVGFNPELTGRENVFLNGALLGFSRAEMESMYDDIVDFAEIADFMDEKLKNYSSGMQVRLAFSIAIKAEGDILLLDEVLAVGDEAFQRKCNEYFADVKQKHKTVILVTHSMDAVQKFCTRALFLNEGKIAHIGSPREVAEKYSKQNDTAYAKSVEKTAEKSHKEAPKSNYKVEIINKKGKSPVAIFKQGEVAKVKLSWDYEDVRHVGVALVDQMGRDVFSPNTLNDGFESIRGRELVYSVNLNLNPGKYSFRSALMGESGASAIDRDIEGVDFIVERSGSIPQYVGVTHLDHEWSR